MLILPNTGKDKEIANRTPKSTNDLEKIDVLDYIKTKNFINDIPKQCENLNHTVTFTSIIINRRYASGIYKTLLQKIKKKRTE